MLAGQARESTVITRLSFLKKERFDSNPWCYFSSLKSHERAQARIWKYGTQLYRGERTFFVKESNVLLKNCICNFTVLLDPCMRNREMEHSVIWCFKYLVFIYIPVSTQRLFQRPSDVHNVTKKRWIDVQMTSCVNRDLSFFKSIFS